MRIKSVLNHLPNKQLLFSSNWEVLDEAMFYVLVSKIALLIISISSLASLFLFKPESFLWYILPSILAIWSVRMLLNYREYFTNFCVSFQIFYFICLYLSKKENEETIWLMTNEMSPHIRQIFHHILTDFKKEGLDDGIIK